MFFTRRKFLILTTTVSSACALPGFAKGALEGVDSLGLPQSIANRVLYKRLTDPGGLPTARTCLICRNPIETVGGQKLIYTRLRGTKLADKSEPFFRENFRGRIDLFEEGELMFVAWGEKQFMTSQVIDRAKSTYLQGKQPWCCQVCGKRLCHLCGTPLIWLAFGDHAFDDGGRGYYSKGANLGYSPPCTNQKCELYRDRNSGSEDSGEVLS